MANPVDFLTISFAVGFGLFIYTLFMFILYLIFFREKEEQEIAEDKTTISDKTKDMEEIPIDV